MMLRVVLLLVAASLFFGTAHAAPTVCHGHNRACAAAAAPAASATLTVTLFATSLQATGCQPGSFVNLHVTYNTAGTATFNVDGYTTAGVDGSVDFTYDVGSVLVSAITRSTYTNAAATVECDGLVLTAST